MKETGEDSYIFPLQALELIPIPIQLSFERYLCQRLFEAKSWRDYFLCSRINSYEYTELHNKVKG